MSTSSKKPAKQSLIPNKSLELTTLTIVIIFAAFFAFFKINEIPPGVQYDQLRAVLMPEFFLKGFTDLPSIRQITSYFLLHGYLAYFLTDIYRTTFDTAGMIFASRLPSALLFIQSVIIWWFLLKELKISIYLRLLFFGIFIPSATFIVFSHYIPQVGGYLFLTSASIYTFIKTLNAKPPFVYIYFYLSIILAFLSTYTQVISAIFIVVFYLFFILLLLLIKRDLCISFLKSFLSSKVTAAITIIVITGAIVITFFPLLRGYTATDQALQSRDSFTILYLFQNDEPGLALESAGRKLKAYMHPNTLVTSNDLISGLQPISGSEWYDIRNPRYNQWLITNLSPFGPLTAFIYIGIIFLLDRISKKDLGIILTISLFLTYLVLVIFPNYDNPSIAKTIPALMFIPLVLIFCIRELISIFKSKRVLASTTVILATLLVLINAFLNISYMYSNDYALHETEKFYYHIDDAVSYITHNTDLQNVRIAIHDHQWNNITFPQFFMSPHILNRTRIINETSAITQDMFDLNDDNIILTKFKDDIDQVASLGISSKITTFKLPNGNDELYLIHLDTSIITADSIGEAKSLTGSVSNNISNVRCTNLPYYPEYHGEFELLHHGYWYYPRDTADKVFVDNCDIPVPQYIYTINPTKVSLIENMTSYIPRTAHGDILKIEDITQQFDNISTIEQNEEYSSFTLSTQKNIADYMNIDTIGGRYHDTEWSLEVVENPGVWTFGIPPTYSPGTFYIEFSYTQPENGDMNITIMDVETRQMTPVPSLLHADCDDDGNCQYSTIFSTRYNTHPVVSLVLVNTTQLLDKTKHKATTTISNFQLFKISSDDIINTPITNESTVSRAIPGTSKITFENPFVRLPFLQSAEIEIDKGTLLTIDAPYNPNYILFDNRYKKMDIKSTTINGWLQGYSVKDDYSGQVHIFNISIIYTAIVGIGTILFYGFLMIIMIKEPKNKDPRTS